MKKTNCRICESCTTCKYVFVFSDYDAPPSYFCTFNAEKRPICGSVGMNEKFETYTTDLDEWETWSTENRVSEHVTCDNYERNTSVNLD